MVTRTSGVGLSDGRDSAYFQTGGTDGSEPSLSLQNKAPGRGLTRPEAATFASGSPVLLWAALISWRPAPLALLGTLLCGSDP